MKAAGWVLLAAGLLSSSSAAAQTKTHQEVLKSSGILVEGRYPQP